jgi:hypothetical protein
MTSSTQKDECVLSMRMLPTGNPDLGQTLHNYR